MGREEIVRNEREKFQKKRKKDKKEKFQKKQRGKIERGKQKTL